MTIPSAYTNSLETSPSHKHPSWGDVGSALWVLGLSSQSVGICGRGVRGFRAGAARVDLIMATMSRRCLR